MGNAKKRTAVLISGRGSNMTALVEAARDPEYPAEIVLVISNKRDAGGINWAKAQSIATIAIDNRDFTTRETHEAALHRKLVENNIELVCLAGYMRILTPEFVQKWQGKILNIHPSLLPAFPGLNTHKRALAAGVTEHGCTVHYVTGDLDAGTIVAQSKVVVITDDDAENLATRVLEKEHALYPQALAIVAAGENSDSDGVVNP